MYSNSNPIMRKCTLFITLLSVAILRANGQTDDNRFSYTTYLGTGISMNQPSRTPLTWQAIVHYHMNKRFTIGAGTGLSVYEKPLILLYASAQFFITQPKKFTPYLECNIGGSFAAAKQTNGGFYLSPAIGAQLRITRKLKMNVALGYEYQHLERLKKQTDEYFYTEFQEELSHQSLTLKVGVTY